MTPLFLIKTRESFGFTRSPIAWSTVCEWAQKSGQGVVSPPYIVLVEQPLVPGSSVVIFHHLTPIRIFFFLVEFTSKITTQHPSWTHLGEQGTSNN